MNRSDPSCAVHPLDGGASAFANLFGRHYRRVFALCLRMLGDRHDAEDATQETFSRLARSLDRYDPTRPLEPYLLKIAGNRCRTELAKRWGERFVMLGDEPACAADQRASDARQLREEVLLALRGVSADQRQAFLLFHDEGLDYAAIGSRLNCPVGTIKTRVRRARLHLIRQLRERDVVVAPVSQTPVEDRR